MEFLKLSRFKFSFILTACLLINACSQLSPYIDRRRNVNAQTAAELYVGPSRPEAPAICYNKLTSTFKEIQKLADAECVEQETGTHAVLVKETLFTCKLLLPNHLYFKCVN